MSSSGASIHTLCVFGAHVPPPVCELVASLFSFLWVGRGGLCAVCRGEFGLALVRHMQCSSRELDRLAGGLGQEFRLVCILWWMCPRPAVMDPGMDVQAHHYTDMSFWPFFLEFICADVPTSAFTSRACASGEWPGTCVLKLLRVATQWCHVLGRSDHVRYGLCIWLVLRAMAGRSC